MTDIPFPRPIRSLRTLSNALDRVLGIAAPMDLTVQAGIAAATETTPTTDAQLMTAAATLLASMSAGRPECSQAVGALIPALTVRAEFLTQVPAPNVIAAQHLFPQHTR